MTDEELSSYIPKHGDRLRLKRFLTRSQKEETKTIKGKIADQFLGRKLKIKDTGSLKQIRRRKRNPKK